MEQCGYTVLKQTAGCDRTEEIQYSDQTDAGQMLALHNQHNFVEEVWLLQLFSSTLTGNHTFLLLTSGVILISLLSVLSSFQPDYNEHVRAQLMCLICTGHGYYQLFHE